jgi:flagellar motor switch protein FliG
MSAGFRNAALKLHGLAAPDRDWILQQLPAHDSKTLSALLDELRALGIRSDQDLAEQASGGDVRQAMLDAGGAVGGLGEALDALCAAPADRIAAVLAAEPDQMVAAVLSAYPWPWRARLLADYPPDKRQRLGRALQQAAPLKPRAQAELVKLLAERLAALPPAARPPVAGPAPRRSLFQGWRRWLR